MNNEQNMTQNIDQTTQTAAEQANAAQTVAEQKLAKKKLTRRIFIGGGLGALAVVGGTASKRKRLRLRHRRPHRTDRREGQRPEPHR